MITRRAFIGTTGMAGLALATARCVPSGQRVAPADASKLRRPTGTPEAVAEDESFWSEVADYYRVPDDFTNLEAGYFGMMASPVLAEYHRQIDRVNYESSFFARGAWGDEFSAARDRLAAFLRVKPSEIAFTRGATEALQRLIVQYNRIQPGDEVLYADLDYGAMQYAMNALVELRGARVVQMEIPEPATRENVLAAYAEALEAHPRVRLVLLTHLNNKTGLIIPTRDIVALARERGADCVVDAAHSFGQCNLSMDDIGADFVGLNLHKWLGAPVGAGAMYIKEGRLPDVDRMLGDTGSLERIDSRIHTGTANFATFLTVPAALDFNDAVGGAYKAARVHYLRNRWVQAVRQAGGIDVLTPDDKEMVGAITSFRVHGRTGRQENQAVVQELFEQHQLFTVWRNGLARGDCIRVTPALYNAAVDVDRLAAALQGIAARG